MPTCCTQLFMSSQNVSQSGDSWCIELRPRDENGPVATLCFVRFCPFCGKPMQTPESMRPPLILVEQRLEGPTEKPVVRRYTEGTPEYSSALHGIAYSHLGNLPQEMVRAKLFAGQRVDRINRVYHLENWEYLKDPSHLTAGDF